MEFSNKIRSIRVKLALSQDYLANMLDIDASSYSRLENGKREIKINELAIIAKAFDMALIDLITYPDKYVKLEVTKEERTKITFEVNREEREKIISVLITK